VGIINSSKVTLLRSNQLCMILHLDERQWGLEADGGTRQISGKQAANPLREYFNGQQPSVRHSVTKLVITEGPADWTGDTGVGGYLQGYKVRTRHVSPVSPALFKTQVDLFRPASCHPLHSRCINPRGFTFYDGLFPQAIFGWDIDDLAPQRSTLTSQS